MNTHPAVLDHPVQKSVSGWFWVGAIALVYAALYALNILVPLDQLNLFHANNLTTRIWSWSQYGLALAAAAVILANLNKLRLKQAALAALLSLLCSYSIYLRTHSPVDIIQEGLIVFLTFLGGWILFQGAAQPPKVDAFQGGGWAVLRSILLGALLALPLATINNLYFYLNSGGFELQNPGRAVLLALSPGISEEIIFRFFLMAGILRLLEGTASRRAAIIAAVVLGVVPHSLNHLPDLFLVNPLSAAFLLVTTSLLFGLPMALLQLKRNLESAISFHWFVDFARFLFGF